MSKATSRKYEITKDLSDEFAEFCGTLSNQFVTKDSNLFNSSSRQVHRYIEFLSIAQYKWLHASVRAVDASDAMLQRERKLGARRLSTTDIRILTAVARKQTAAQYEVECFYLMAKILLDRIALFVKYSFGDARGLSIKSHHKWSKNCERYCEAKGMTCSKGLQKQLVRLQEQVGDYRDDRIAHLRDHRIMHGTLYGPKTGVKISGSHLYPVPGDKSFESPSVDDTAGAIVEYVHQIMQFLEDNKGKMRFKVQPPTNRGKSKRATP